MRAPREGDVIQTGVRFKRRSGIGHGRDHIATVEQVYGSNMRRLWVRPLCGKPAGQAEHAFYAGTVCARCTAVAKAKEISVTDRSQS